jgi:hypothetical protein
MEAAPSATFKLSESDLLLEFLIIALNAPPQPGNIDERRKIDVIRQGRKPVFVRLLLAHEPLDQRPFLQPRRSELLIVMRGTTTPLR